MRASLRRRLPIQNQRERRRDAVLVDIDEQEPLTIRRRHVLLACNPDCAVQPRLEEWRGISERQLAARVATDGYRRQPVDRVNVVQLAAVMPPAHLRPAGSGHTFFQPCGAKRLNVDLGVTGFVRLIRDPPAVGRELTVPVVVRCRHHRERLTAFRGHRVEVVIAGRRIKATEQDEVAIGRPVAHGLDFARPRRKQLRGVLGIRRLHPQRGAASPV